MTSTGKRGTPVHLSGDSQPTLITLPSPGHMTGEGDSSEDEEYVVPSTPVGNPPSTTEAVEDDRQSVAPELVSDISNIAQPPYLIRQSLMWTVNMNKNKRVNQRVTQTLEVLYQQPQGEVPEVQRAYLQCAMDRYK